MKPLRKSGVPLRLFLRSCRSMPWIGASPVFLIFCADPRRLEEIGRLRGHDQPQRDLEAFLNSSVDAALAMQTFILAAEASGLGCCPISVIRNKMEDVVQILSLPPGVFPVSGLCVGYPAGEGHISMRLPPALTVHTDGYEDKALKEEIEAYDRRRAKNSVIQQGSVMRSSTAGRKISPGRPLSRRAKSSRHISEEAGLIFEAWLLVMGR